MELDLNSRIAAEVLDGLHGRHLQRMLVKMLRSEKLEPFDFSADWLLWGEWPAMTAAIAARALRREARLANRL